MVNNQPTRQRAGSWGTLLGVRKYLHVKVTGFGETKMLFEGLKYPWHGDNCCLVWNNSRMLDSEREL